MKQPAPPKINDGTHVLRLSAREFAALLERQPATVVNDEPRTYYFTIFPITFWVPAQEWQEHNLRVILHNCAAKWKDVLTEPTLQKIRALLPNPILREASLEEC